MHTTIAISKETRNLLLEFGKKSENYDEVIRRMYNTLMMHVKLKEFVDQQSYSTLDEAEEWTKMKIKMMK